MHLKIADHNIIYKESEIWKFSPHQHTHKAPFEKCTYNLCALSSELIKDEFQLFINDAKAVMVLRIAEAVDDAAAKLLVTKPVKTGCHLDSKAWMDVHKAGH